MNKNADIGYSYRIIIFSLAYGISFYYLKMFSKQNSWLIITISSILGFSFIKMISNIKNTYKNKNIYEINKIVLGNKLGTITNIIFALTFGLLSIIITWYLLVFLKSNFLEKTPNIIIGLGLIIPIIYATTKNNIVLTKSNVIFSFIILLLSMIAISFLSFQMDFSNLKPFEEIKSRNMVYALLCFTSTTFLPTYALSGLDNLDNKKIPKHMFKSFLLIFSLIISTYLVLGNSMVEFVDFPQFFVLRKIGIISNGTRIDSLIIIGWFLSVYAANISFLFFIRNYLNYELKPYKVNYMYLLIGIIFLISLNIFKNVTTGKIFILNILPYLLFFTLFFFNFIIYYIIKVKHKNVSHKY